MDSLIKERLIKHLEGGQAFTSITDFIDEITFDKVGVRPNGLPYSFYELFYHITYAQKDILDFCQAKSYKTPNWPDDYWPKNSKPNNEEDWAKLKKDYFEDRKNLADFVNDPKNDLMKPVKNGKDQTLLREILLVIEHSAYHTGQLIIILRLLGLHGNS